jgi:hypothetical protein
MKLGISSNLAFLMKRPKGVILSSSRDDSSGPFFSASLNIERNLYILKGFPYCPMRSWLYKTGPFEVILMPAARNRVTGSVISIASKAIVKSSIYFTFSCHAGITS